MSNEQKKNEFEGHVLSLFLECTGEECSVERRGKPGEEPDFIMKDRVGMFGFELTQAFAQAPSAISRDGKIRTRREAEGVRARLLRRLEAAWPHSPVQVRFHSRVSSRAHELAFQNVDLPEILAAVEEACSNSPRLYRYGIARRDWGGVRAFSSPQSCWQVMNDSVGWIDQSGDPILTALRSKNRKFAKFKIAMPLDLLIFCNPGHASGAIKYLPEMELPSRIFRRAFFFRMPNDAVTIKLSE